MSGLITRIGWLEPLLPESLPAALLEKAEAVSLQAARLGAILPSATASRIASLLKVTNSYYSNLIEGNYTEPAKLAECAPKRSPKRLTELAITHMQAQGALERALDRYQVPWQQTFSPEFVALVHRRLFRNASNDDLRLTNGTLMVPGQRRDAVGLNVSVGGHDAPDFSAVPPMLARLHEFYGRTTDSRRRLLATLAYHHRLAWVHPFADGNGRVVRMVTHLQLYRLGLVSPLWSLSRGLARQQAQYYARLANADAPRRGDLDGRGQLTQAGLFEFIDFMLDTSLDQLGYMLDALRVAPLRERLQRIVAFEPRLIEAGIKQECARALCILLTQGQVTRNDFKVYLGLGERVAIEQLKRLTALGLVVSRTPKARELEPGLPAWFAQTVFLDLHRRF